MTPQQYRLYWLCEDLLSKGIKPTPTEIEKHEPSMIVRRGRNVNLMNGRLTEARTKAFIDAGWRRVVVSNPKRMTTFATYRWQPPS